MAPHFQTVPTLDQLSAMRTDILRLAAARHANNVRVFGSVARGEADAQSDVDFLVDLEPDATLFDLSGLILDLEEALGCKVSVVEIREASPISDRILSEAIPL